MAFAVVDQYQGQGIGATLMHHLATIARSSGFRELIAQVLPDNTAMLTVFEKSGFGLSTERGSGVAHVALQLTLTRTPGRNGLATSCTCLGASPAKLCNGCAAAHPMQHLV